MTTDRVQPIREAIAAARETPDPCAPAREQPAAQEATL